MNEVFIPAVLPGMNEVIAECGKSPHAYGRMKKKWGMVVGLCARGAGFPRIDGPRHFEFEFVEPNRKRDPDNIAGAAQKILFDALQEASLLPKDSWDYVTSIAHTFRVAKPGEKVGIRLTVR